jgi:hypothetical protein
MNARFVQAAEFANRLSLREFPVCARKSRGAVCAWGAIGAEGKWIYVDA